MATGTETICDGASFGTIKVATWRPNERIELTWPGPGRVYFVIAACWGIPPGVALGLIVAIVGRSWLLAPLPVVFCCAFTSYVDWLFFRPRHFVLDWPKGQLDWRLGRTSGSAELSAIASINRYGLLLRTTTVRPRRIYRRTFAGRLVLQVHRRRLTVCHSLETLTGDDASPYSDLNLLQENLARALGDVRTDQEDYRHGGVLWCWKRIWFPWFEFSA